MALCYGSLSRQKVFPQTHTRTHPDTLSYTKITHPHEAHTDSHTQTLTSATHTLTPFHTQTLLSHPHAIYTILAPFTHFLTRSHVLPKARDSGCGFDCGSGPHGGQFPSLNGGLCSLSSSLLSLEPMHPGPFACTLDFLHPDPSNMLSVLTLAWTRTWEA